MEAKFSHRVKDVIALSKEEAIRLNNESISVEHILMGMTRLTDGTAIKIFREFQLDLSAMRKEIETILLKSAVDYPVQNTNIPLLKQAERIIKMTYLEAKQFKSAIAAFLVNLTPVTTILSPILTCCALGVLTSSLSESIFASINIEPSSFVKTPILLFLIFALVQFL